jgi:hypothetical protein
MKMKPNQLSLNKLRKEGYAVGVVERFVRFPPPGHRVDLFGFADIVAIKDDVLGVLAVNPTTKTNLSAHIKKYLINDKLPIWLKAGNKFEIHSWYKKRIGRTLWQVDVKEFLKKDFTF